MNNQEFLKSITLDGEEWRDIIGFKGLYKVSSYGRVVSLGRCVNNRYQDVYKQPHLLRTNNTKREKTPSVTLSIDGKDSKRHLPYLVAQHFLCQPDNNYVLEAKDGDFYNCKVDNLYWRRKKRARKLYDTASLEGEVWRSIQGYEGLYEISSLGRIKSSYSRKILNPSSVHGYKYVSLAKNSTIHKHYIHRLVAKAFVPNPNNYPCIDHINTIRTDNTARNLRWCTYLQNMLNPITNSKRTISVCKLRNGVLIHIYESMAEAHKDGFSSASIFKCCRGLQSRHKGYEWMYTSDYKSLINKPKNSQSTNID